jgi:hypothetical protein
MVAHCGLVNATAACSCARRIGAAVARGRVDPQRLMFAGNGLPAPKRLPVLEAVGEMERLHELAAIHQSHPRVEAPEGVRNAIKRALDAARLRVLP